MTFPSNHFSRKSGMLRLTWRLIAAGFIVALSLCHADAQSPTDGMTPSGLTPGNGAGSYGLSGFDNVNLYNGNLNFSMPLLGIGGRGSAQTHMTLNFDSVHWQVEKADNINYPQPNWWEGIGPGYGPGVLQARNGEVDGVGLVKNTLTRLTFTSPDGTEYQLIDIYHGGTPYSVTGTTRNRGTVFVSHDGSFLTFVSNSTIYDQLTEATYSDGISGYLYFSDGTRYEISDGTVTKIRDRNGNLISFTYDSYKRVTDITDSLNRQVTITYANMSTVFYDEISYKGFGGAQRSIKVWRASLGSCLRSEYSSTQTYAQLFPNLSGSDSTTYNPAEMVSAVELPDGRSYQLRYNPYGELARVVLPTGGAIEYDYTDMGDSTRIQRRVAERRVYADGTNLESKQVYAASYGSTSSTTVEDRDASNNLLAKSQHYFYGNPLGSVSFFSAVSYSNWQEGREYQSESLALDGSTILRRVENSWEQGATVTSHLASVNAANNPRINQTVTTLVDTSQVAKQTFNHDDYNNNTDVYEYDFGSGSAGSLVRHTHTDFMTSNSVNSTDYTASSNNLYFYHLPSQTSVFEGSVERARTTFEYDNYGSSSGHAGLVNRSSISGLDSGFTTSYGTRGNVTATTRSLLNTSGSVIGSIASYSQYDIAGNVTVAVDPRGNATTFGYDDCFGAPNGNAQTNTAPYELSSASKTSYAMLTSVTNALSQTAYAQYDYYLGKAVDGEDMNGVVASGYYDDALDRPTKVIRDYNNLAAKSKIEFSYDDTNHIVTTRSDFTTYDDKLLRKDSLYDGLGRTTETRVYESSTAYIATRQIYDALGRTYQVSNPYRSGETVYWTTTAYDELSRVTTVTAPDSSVVTTSYSGNAVTVTDQGSKVRKSVADALGRLTNVYEDPTTGGLNYQTTYSYDVLNNLTGVTQGSQSRTFVYDSLKRLTSASNPESGTVESVYDDNGNLLVTTDARGVSTHVSYDVLNRPTRRWYNSSSSTSSTTNNSPALPSGVAATNEVAYVYDAQSLPSGAPSSSSPDYYSRGYTTGRLVAVNYGGGSAGNYLGYNALGRVTTSIQQTDSINYKSSASYNLAGSLVTETYPSGHTVTNGFDAVGRTSSVTGTLGDNTSRTYSTGIAYTSAGQLTQEQFGTTTAVYNKALYNNRLQLTDALASTAGNDTSWNRGKISNDYGTTNNSGNLRRQTVYVPNNDANTSSTSWYQDYDYDSLNRLQRVHEYTGNTALDWQQEYIYDRWGNRTIHQSNTYGTGIPKPDFTVDADHNRLGVPSGQSGTMSYDAAGNLTTDTYRAAAVTRAYDAENRMTSETQASSYVAGSYTYDGNGRRVKRVVGGTETWQVYGIGGALVAEYAANNSASSPQKEYGYRNGHLLVTLTSALPGGAPSFSDERVQVGVTVVKAAHITELRTAINNLRVHLGMSAYSWTTSATTSDYISANPIIELRTALDQALGAPVGGYAAGLASGQPIKAIHIQELRDRLTAASALDVRWMVTDQLGTPRMVFDQSGSLANVSRHDYLPFGEEVYAGCRATTPGFSVGDGARQQFTGYEHDAEIELNFAQARYQSSTQGRFTSPDPFGGSMNVTDPQSFNRYAYAGNNPLNRTDPSGLDWTSDASKQAASSYYGHQIGSGWSMLDSKGKEARDFQGIELAQPQSEPEQEPQEEVSVEVVGDEFEEAVDPQNSGTILILVGDPGLGQHNQGPNFDRAAETKRKELTAQGYGVIKIRVSTIEEVNHALMNNGVLAGVEYIGHAGSGALYVGQNAGANTNIDSSNVSQLSNSNLAPNAYIKLNGCNAGQGGWNSIAGQLANHLDRTVYAFNGDTKFYSSPNAVRGSGGSQVPRTGPLYLMEDAGTRLVAYRP